MALERDYKAAYLWMRRTLVDSPWRPTAAKLRRALLEYAQTRVPLMRSRPPGAVKAVKQFARAGEGNPSLYSPEETLRRFPRGGGGEGGGAVRTGGVEHGLAAHRDVEVFNRKLWSGHPEPPEPRVLVGRKLAIELANNQLLLLASEMPAGGGHANRVRWATRVDAICLDLRYGSLEIPLVVFVELKTGRDNEVYTRVRGEPPVGDPPLADQVRFPGAYATPADRDQLQLAVTVAFAHMSYARAGDSLVQTLRRALQPTQVHFDYYMLRVLESRPDAHLGSIPTKWVESLIPLVAGVPYSATGTRGGGAAATAASRRRSSSRRTRVAVPAAAAAAAVARARTTTTASDEGAEEEEEEGEGEEADWAGWEWPDSDEIEYI